MDRKVVANSRSRRWIVFGLIAFGFVLRMSVALFLGLNKAPEPGTDSEEYDTYAWNVAQGRGYRGMSPDVADQDHLTAYRPPGTSLIWAGLFSVFGHRYDVIRIFNCLAGAASIGLVYAIGRRCFGTTTALLSAAIYTVWPVALLFSSALLSEVPGTLLFLGYLVACLAFADHPNWRLAIIAGVLLGLALLTRPNPLLMIPLTAVWAICQFRGNRQAQWRGLAIPIFTLMTMSPWWARNAIVFGRFVPLSTQGGSALLQGNNRIVANEPDFYGYSIWDTKIPEYQEELQAAGDEFERDRRAGRFAVDWLKANANQFPRMAWNKVLRGWTPFLRPQTSSLYRLGTLASWGPVLLLFIVGFVPTCVAFLRSAHPGWLTHLTVVSSLAMTVILFGELRYRYTVEPICIVISSSVAVWGIRKVMRVRAV